MSAMLSAIQNRKSGGMMSEKPQHELAEGGTDLQSLVDSLSDEQKMELQGLLADSSKPEGSASEIAKGEASTEEQGQIKKSMASDEMIGSDESDDIGMSMLEGRDKGQTPITEPRNLGERMRMSVSNKLKAKGKL